MQVEALEVLAGDGAHGDLHGREAHGAFERELGVGGLDHDVVVDGGWVETFEDAGFCEVGWEGARGLDGGDDVVLAEAADDFDGDGEGGRVVGGADGFEGVGAWGEVVGDVDGKVFAPLEFATDLELLGVELEEDVFRPGGFGSYPVRHKFCRVRGCGGVLDAAEAVNA